MPFHKRVRDGITMRKARVAGVGALIIMVLVGSPKGAINMANTVDGRNPFRTTVQKRWKLVIPL